MNGTITISGKSLGTKRRLFQDWSVPYPPDLQEYGGRLTLRDLIERIVRAEVQHFRERQRDRAFIRALTARQINEAVERGRVDAGGHGPPQPVDEDAGVGAAIQAFDDGLYLVVVDDEQHRDLDREVFLRPDSRVTFVRLAMLAGG